MGVKRYTIKLAGQEFELNYSDARIRRDIEKRSGKAIVDALSDGVIEDHIIVLWGGIKSTVKGKGGKPLTTDDVYDLVNEHNNGDGDGDFFTDIFKPIVTRAVLESRVCGKWPPMKVDEICGKLPEKEAPVVPQ
jgi:hypothetical protein